MMIYCFSCLKNYNQETGPSQLYKPNDGRLVVYKLTNVKALKYNFYVAPEEIKEN